MELLSEKSLLEAKLSKLSESYYNTTDPKKVEKDEVYDQLVEEYTEKFGEYNKVGFTPAHGEKVILPFYMGSLKKVKDANALRIWLQKYSLKILPDGKIERGIGISRRISELFYIITDKIDGVSCQFIYKNGVISLHTRGDGTTGVNITRLVPYIFGDMKLDLSSETKEKSPTKNHNEISIRGELVILHKDFESYKEDMANPRNMASGLVNAKSINEKATKKLTFIAYQIYENTPQSQQLEKLQKLGFNVPKYEKVQEKDINIKYLSQTLDHFIAQAKYDIDGLVISADIPVSLKEMEEMKGKDPKHLIAYKKNFGKASEVIDVEWNVSSHGFLKPRVKITPTEVSGATISWATGHNAKYIVENGIGKGAKISISRSGGVIPKIFEVFVKSEPILPPGKINVDWKWNDTEVDIIQIGNSEKLEIRKIVEFFKKLDAKYVGEKTIQRLYESGNDTLKKFFNLKQKEVEQVDGFKKKSAEKVIEAIKKSITEVELHRVMSASGIFGIGFGEKKLKLIVDNIPDVLKCKDEDDLHKKIAQIQGFKTTIPQFIEKLPELRIFLTNHPEIKYTLPIEEKEEDNIEIVFDDEEQGSTKEKNSKQRSVSLNLDGKSFVFTGFRNKELEKKIESFRGRVTTAVSRRTSYVVVRSRTSSGKEIKAMELGVSIITESELEKMLNC